MALVQVALEHARARAGVQVVTLTVTEGNETALNLYRRAGFQAWGTQPIAVVTPSGYRGKVHMCCFLTRRTDGAVACEAQSANTSRACQ
jgi:RimJ/RimL family protein N-acetyltransferase